MRQEQSVILLDMDGVLLHPVGYKGALQETVNHFAGLMGLEGSFAPEYDDISVFEANGLANEWDSTVMCVAMLMLAALEVAPQLARANFADTVAVVREEEVGKVKFPDYMRLAQGVGRLGVVGSRPYKRVLDLLLESAPQATHAALQDLMGIVYDLDAPTTRTFQHHTLGSRRFAETYQQAADFESPSLLERDHSLLDDANREWLLQVAESRIEGMYVAIYTARPSLQPADADDDGSVNSVEIAPEAEIGRELVGLEALPLIGTGRLAWLAAGNGAHSEDYVKPSPVQALAAIGSALSRSEAPALQAALAFTEDGTLDGPLSLLKDRVTRVYVFEDSVGGIQAVIRAVEMLRAGGIDASYEAIGISPNASKRAALQKVTSHMVDEVNEGLGAVVS